MSNDLISRISKPIIEHMRTKTSYLAKFVTLDTGPEEWFRVEILAAILDSTNVQILRTNQRYSDVSGRPDFVMESGKEIFYVELKVLPPDSNYETGYQRFCSGKTNKADFDALSNEERHLVIYVHWPRAEDFSKTKENLGKRYNVTCKQEGAINFSGGTCTISFWTKRV